MNDIELFRRLSPHNEFREYLQRQQQATYRQLESGVDTHTIFRAQGKLIVLNELLQLMAKAREA